MYPPLSFLRFWQFDTFILHSLLHSKSVVFFFFVVAVVFLVFLERETVWVKPTGEGGGGGRERVSWAGSMLSTVPEAGLNAITPRSWPWPCDITWSILVFCFFNYKGSMKFWGAKYSQTISVFKVLVYFDFCKRHFLWCSPDH